jgi:hypothetical protein
MRSSVEMEPEWTKSIPSWLVCDWFYAFFIIGAIISAGLIIMIIYLMSASGVSIKEGGLKLFMLIAQLGIALTSTLFYYVICARSLRPVA